MGWHWVSGCMGEWVDEWLDGRGWAGVLPYVTVRFSPLAIFQHITSLLGSPALNLVPRCMLLSCCRDVHCVKRWGSCSTGAKHRPPHNDATEYSNPYPDLCCALGSSNAGSMINRAHPG